jgi:phage repressor protein C with HTH and peptisase S24 domain
MLSHEAIWRALDLVAHQNGLSPSGFAIKAGLDPTSLNLSKRISPPGRKRWPSTESLSKLLAAVGMDLVAFATLVEASSDSPAAAHKRTDR